MDCVLILIAGIYLNPCTIASMEDSTSLNFGRKSCRIYHNSGDAWSGQHNTIIKMHCSEIAKIIEETK